MTAGKSGIEIGIDIGGTFTDIVCRRSGEPDTIFKLPTTRSDPGLAVLQAIRELAPDHPTHTISRFVHGTTVATNAVLERKGSKTGLLTTAGFKDVLEIGRQIRTTLYDVILEPETPVFLAPGVCRIEIDGRIDASGEILIPLDEKAVVAAAKFLVAEGVEAVAICFLFSFLNPAHERRARDLILEHYPNIAISLSSDVDPAFREYERTVVTAFDAYIKPIVDGYLDRLEGNLRKAGVSAPLQVMQSRGGAAGAPVVRRRPVRMFLSGPAAGVIGGQSTGTSVGDANLITIDIGGTTSDIALIQDGKPILRAEGIIDGYPIRVPMVDVNPIGAGGGSIAWIDEVGGLRVGPRSAGSDPGPACYDAGGTEATVTDASVVLGYIDPQNFAGGTLPLDPLAARQAIELRVAKPLGLTLEEAALGIHRVVNAQMAEGIRLVSIQKGFDPRDFTLVGLGGAGPLHVVALAEELGVIRILVPRYPGVLSATGLLAAPVEHEMSASFARPLDGLDVADVRFALDTLDSRAGELMREDGVALSTITTHHSADLCFIGQSYHLEVPINLNADAPLEALRQDFHALHDRIYGYSAGAPARIVNLRSVLHAGGDSEPIFAPRTGTNTGIKTSRNVLFSDIPVKSDIYTRESLPAEVRIVGPAIIEQADTTTLIPSGWLAENGNSDTLILTPCPAEHA